MMSLRSSSWQTMTFHSEAGRILEGMAESLCRIVSRSQPWGIVGECFPESSPLTHPEDGVVAELQALVLRHSVVPDAGSSAGRRTASRGGQVTLSG